jgi:acetyl-CoA C-acetyltransferase
MPKAFIVDAVRTPVGRRGGGLAGAHPADLGAHVITAALPPLRPGGLVTAALSSQIADGAAALLIASGRAVRETGADLARVNACGGAIALGHPLGATGARLLTTLVHALERTSGRYGMVTMCEGGGQANVTIIERA